MVTAKPKEEASQWAEYEKDPNCEWIEYREPVTTQENIPGQGPTSVQSYVIHRVPLKEWPAYEQSLKGR